MELARGDHISPAAPGISTILPQGKGEATWDSSLPAKSVARIWKPARSAMTSGRARSKDWRLRIERASVPSIEPLMGWTAGKDTAHQVELSFPSLEAAVRHAERLGIAYEVHLPPGEAEARQQAQALERQRHAHAARLRRFSDQTLDRLGLAQHRDAYRRALGAPVGDVRKGATPMEVAQDTSLPLETRRSILMSIAFNEYLQDLATSEGMPEHHRQSRLSDVETALRALEGAQHAQQVA
ncbi:NADH dehydrogenase ubiquinone Fe-S protein 4 [Paracoccus sp. J55]|uniref:NADH dehydrogenase ubiquinone Fe-S protein 4 n=1 Tax=Paracoccus sp. J55 TaxID=935849 RepID=UPI0004B6EC0C|nr:NADH dehydrogenase ubiquinone Fe-S protein 4 [Paracoccus sp. J55]